MEIKGAGWAGSSAVTPSSAAGRAAQHDGRQAAGRVEEPSRVDRAVDGRQQAGCGRECAMSR
jgi:hypothetical protein